MLKAKSSDSFFRDWQWGSPVNCFASRKSLCEASHKLFKLMKQHLHIKEFFGHNENAIQIQIYTAIAAYCIVAIAEHQLKLDRDLYEVLRVLQGSLFEKTPIGDFFKNGPKWQIATKDSFEDKLQLMLNF